MRLNQQTDGRRKRGYSLLELGVATAVLGITIASSMLILRMGFSMMESARDNTLVSQILQSEMENLRLKNWNQISALSEGAFEVESTFDFYSVERFSTDLSIQEL